MPRCRACNAPVVFITSAKGRPMICETKVRREWILPTRLADAADRGTLSRIALTLVDGTVRAGYIVGEGWAGAQLTIGRESHFGSCPQREKFRRWVVSQFDS